MGKHTPWGLYGLVSGFKQGAIVAAQTQNKAVECFCRLHCLHPDQVAGLWWVPIS